MMGRLLTTSCISVSVLLCPFVTSPLSPFFSYTPRLKVNITQHHTTSSHNIIQYHASSQHHTTSSHNITQYHTISHIITTSRTTLTHFTGCQHPGPSYCHSVIIISPLLLECNHIQHTNMGKLRHHMACMMLLLFVFLLILGISITLFSTYRSVLKYLKMKLDELY